MNRPVGLALVGLSIGICVLGGAYLFSGVLSNPQRLEMPAAILGFGLLFVVLVGPLMAGGFVIVRKGQQDVQEAAESSQMRKVLDVVQTRGSVEVSDLAIELKADMSNVQNVVYRLVGMGVFTGYVNWADGILYSADAAGLRDLTECKKCGGKLALVGKGVIKCPYCETEYFVA